MNKSKLILFLKENFWFFLSFGFTKGAVFIAPLLLAEVLTKEEFGLFEYSLAGLGFIINALINLGIPAAYPYFIVKQEQNNFLNTFRLHPFLLGIVFVANQILWLVGIPEKVYLSLNVAYIVANQVYYSTILKSHRKPIKAIFFDSGIYILSLLCFALIWLSNRINGIQIIHFALFFYGLYFLIRAVIAWVKTTRTKFWSQYQLLLKYALPVMTGSFFIFLITASGRILMEFFFGLETVAIYGFYYRLAAVVVVIYQMVSILFFRDLYTRDPLTLDRYYALFFGSIGTLALLLTVVLPLFLPMISQFFEESWPENKGLYFLLSGQMTFWIATALNSSIIDRENQAGKNNRLFAILIGVSLLFFALAPIEDLELLVLTHCSIVWLAALIQYYSLSRAGVLFRRSASVLIGYYILLLVTYFSLF